MARLVKIKGRSRKRNDPLSVEIFFLFYFCDNRLERFRMING